MEKQQGINLSYRQLFKLNLLVGPNDRVHYYYRTLSSHYERSCSQLMMFLTDSPTTKRSDRTRKLVAIQFRNGPEIDQNRIKAIFNL